MPVCSNETSRDDVSSGGASVTITLDVGSEVDFNHTA